MSGHLPVSMQRTYTAEELLLLARRHGFQATHRLILDWTGHGLLDRPTRQGLGRGKGTRVVWSQDQADLFLELLGHHQHGGVRSIRELCDVPVARWLYYGDSCGVPLEQVQRAMATWIAAYQRTPYGAMLSTARGLVARAADPAARREDIQTLVETLVGVLMTGRSADARRLHELVVAVSDPTDRPQYGQSLGAAPQARSRRPDGLILARLTAIDELANLPPSLWKWARAFLLCGGSTQRPVLRAHAGEIPRDQLLVFRQVLAPEDMETLRVSVCLELLTLRGLGWAEPAFEHVPALLRPTAWLRSELHATIEVRTLSAPGAAMRRAQRPILRISVTISSPPVGPPVSSASSTPSAPSGLSTPAPTARGPGASALQ